MQDARLSTLKPAPQSARCAQGVASGSWVLGTGPKPTGTNAAGRHGGYPHRIIRNLSSATDDGPATRARQGRETRTGSEFSRAGRNRGALDDLDAESLRRDESAKRGVSQASEFSVAAAEFIGG